MKLIIDIPEKVVTSIQNGEDYRYDIHTAIAQGTPYNPSGDLISREALYNEVDTWGCNDYDKYDFLDAIDNAPTVEQRPQGDLISRTELKKCAIPCEIHNGALTDLCVPLYQIDNAPTVETTKVEHKAYNEGFKDGVDQGIKLSERPHGEWIPNYISQFTNPGRSCSLCNKTVEFSENFCPGCGADMRGEE